MTCNTFEKDNQEQRNNATTTGMSCGNSTHHRRSSSSSTNLTSSSDNMSLQQLLTGWRPPTTSTGRPNFLPPAIPFSPLFMDVNHDDDVVGPSRRLTRIIDAALEISSRNTNHSRSGDSYSTASGTRKHHNAVYIKSDSSYDDGYAKQ
jgi:hypothetical protein